MDTVDLDVDDLFADGDIDCQLGGDGIANSTLHQRDGKSAKTVGNGDSYGESDGDGEANGDDAEMLARLKRLGGAAKSRKPQNPRPKFDAPRLLGERGLPALLPTLQPLLERVRGEGEAEALDRLLRGYELWTHRLFPRFAFDDSIERLERLGRQMPVRTAIKRLRLGLRIDGEGEGEGEDDGESDVERRQDGGDSDAELPNRDVAEARPGEGEGEGNTERRGFDEEDDDEEIAAMVRDAERLAGLAEGNDSL